MRKPNFFVIGAGRSATTSLYNYLKQHPEIFMSPTKETNFFAYQGESMSRQWMGPLEKTNHFRVRTMDSYLAMFRPALEEKAIGEASVLYLHSPCAARRIKEFAPDAKLVAILRHPVERAYSSFYMHVREGREQRSFMSAIRQEQADVEDMSLMFPQRHYLQLGLYTRYLATFFELFKREQFAIYLFDDLKADPLGLMKKLFRFLGVSDTFAPDVSHRYNAAGTATNRWWRALLMKNSLTAAVRKRVPNWVQHHALRAQDVARARRLVKPELPSKLKRELTEFYREDIMKLQDLIGRDLGMWLRSPTA